MDEVLLIKISLTLSVIGIFSLFIISQKLQEPEQPLNRDVTLQGYVKQIQNNIKYSSVILTVPNNEKIIIFHTDLKINKSDFLEIHGTRQGNTIYATDVYKLK